MMVQATERQTFHVLDALRGVAAIMVVLFHCQYVLGYDVAPNGYLAVDLFFLLSGFVISHAYDRRLAGGMTVGRFALIRLVRFWPLYMVGLCLGFLLEALLILTHNHYAMPAAKVLGAFFLGILFIPTPFSTRTNMLYPLNGASWSLFFELIVNIVYALLFRYASKNNLIIATIVFGASYLTTSLYSGTTNVGWIIPEIPPAILRTAFSFSFGVLIYRMNIRAFALPTWLLSLIVVAFMAAPVEKQYELPFCLLFIFIVSPFIVVSGASTTANSRFLPAIHMLGILSYPLYAIHRPLLSFADTIGRRLDVPGVVTCAVYIVGTCALCLLLHKFYDVPFRAWLSGRLGLRSRPGLPSAALSPETANLATNRR